MFRPRSLTHSIQYVSQLNMPVSQVIQVSAHVNEQVSHVLSVIRQVTQHMSHVRTVIASVSEQVSHVTPVRYRCTRTSGHFESLVDCRVVLHCLQIGGAQSKFPLFVALGVFDGVILGVVFEVLRRAVLDVVTLFTSAAHVGWEKTSISGDPATAVFAIMSDMRNPIKTTARTNC